MNKLITVIMSKDTQAQILDRILKNPRTSILGLIAGCCFGGAAKLEDMGFHLAAMLVAGLGALLSVVGLFMAADVVRTAGDVTVIVEEKKSDPPTPPPAV